MRKILICSLAFLSLALSLLVVVDGAAAHPVGTPAKLIDVATLSTDSDPLTRLSGAVGEDREGGFGLPVAGGSDVDGDGLADYAVAYMSASPIGREFAGEVYLIFGNGLIGEAVDLADPSPRVLRIIGDGDFETTGNGIWIGDVTGDHLSDVLIHRQNFTFAGRVGAGAVTVLAGGAALRALADDLEILDLRNPPSSVDLFTIVGAEALDRLGMWARGGDLDGDGVNDLVIGADQVSSPTEAHHGAVYVVRGGDHLGKTGTLDLADFGTSFLAGKVARILPPPGSAEHHFGATCDILDLNGNGRGELLAAKTLGRIGGFITPTGLGGHTDGGPPGGGFTIVWDSAFPHGPWPAGFTIDLGSPPPGTTVVNGGEGNVNLGEEMLGGLDYNSDGKVDLFIGDLAGDGTAAGNRPFSGIGYIFFQARKLRGKTFVIDNAPNSLKLTRILGPEIPSLGGDAAAHGDFDGDGLDDLFFGSPAATPLDRVQAGIVHIFFGRHGSWPKLIDTAEGALPPRNKLRITEVWGALGFTDVDAGDTLGYNAATGDLDGDGRTDLIVNEMRGNGVDPAALDVGNLLLIGGDLLKPPPPGHGNGPGRRH